MGRSVRRKETGNVVCWLCAQSKGKYAGKIMKKKTKAEKESSPFNVFMKAELTRLKQVTCSPTLRAPAVYPLRRSCWAELREECS